MKLYICESGEALSMACKHRSEYFRLRAGLFVVAKSFGSTEVMLDYTLMRIVGIRFTKSNPPPDGWISPKWMDGNHRPPKKCKDLELMKSFTPGGCYSLIHPPELAAFEQWLKLPPRYCYLKTGIERGSCSIDNPFIGSVLSWFSINSPIACALPDLDQIKKNALAEGCILTDNALDWKPPEGLRLSSQEEWDYLIAKYKYEESLKSTID